MSKQVAEKLIAELTASSPAEKALIVACDKSRLPVYVSKLIRNEPMEKLTYLKHYKKEYVRSRYGVWGRSSGLNPGVMWPKKEELEHLKQFERAFYPSLEDMIVENQTKKKEKLEARAQREKEVLRNLQKLPGEIQAFFDKLDAKQKEKDEWTKKREKTIEEVREILGYAAKPTDPKFLEALAQKETDEIKARKKAERKKRDNATLESLLHAANVKE